jgi:UDP-N-acetylmuramate--alanine ligase
MSTPRRSDRVGAAADGARQPLWPTIAALPSLYPGDHVHLVGVGGAGMSGLARVLSALGLVVSGSDRTDSGVLAALAAEGITVRVGHDAGSLPPDVVLVVRSPAVPDDNAELVAARARGIAVTKRAVMLGALVDARSAVAVAGTHGKTTTAGLVAVILEVAGWAPTFFIGGEAPDLGTNARAGSGQHLVLEADEYDRSFLHGRPLVAVVTGIEHDHPDIYPDLDAVVTAFRAFLSAVRSDGRVIARAGSASVHAALSATTVPVERYWVEGDPEPAPNATVTWRAVNVTASAERQGFDVWRGPEVYGTFAIRLPGSHNVANALAAIAVAAALDVPIDAVRDALERYRGVARRFEVIGRVGGITVVDDYAHHPTEIAATLEAARGRFAGRVWALVQPHTFSRVAALGDDFATALAAADRVVLTPVYAARERPLAGADATRIADGVPGAVVAPDLAAAARIAAADARTGDVLLFMGAGDITTASRDCLGRLAHRSVAALLDVARARGLQGDVQLDAPLAPYTSLRVGGPAAAVVRVRTVDALVGWRRLATEHDVPIRVIGRGSNVLVGDSGFHGLVLVNRCETWVVEPLGDDGAVVRADSGVTLAALGHHLARGGWAGLEAGIGIPGTVGGAVVTNAGAHGWSMGDSVSWVEVLEMDGVVRRRPPDDLAFTYRGSALKGDATRCVLRVGLTVTRATPSAVQERIDRFIARRRATQPTAPSAGSTFRNPRGDAAGRLIDAAGLKGTTRGGAQISPVHANFIVNTGGATAADVTYLIDLIRRTVRRRFGITLELEIEPIGARDVV